MGNRTAAGAAPAQASEKGAKAPVEAYAVGTRLVHHTGSVWEVTKAELPGDGKTWREGSILCEGDYRIRCVRVFAEASVEREGRDMRVHRDYLHGDGWRVVAGAQPAERPEVAHKQESRSSVRDVTGEGERGV